MGFAKYCLLFCIIAAVVLSNATASPIQVELDNEQLKKSAHNIIDTVKKEACKAAKALSRSVCINGCSEVYPIGSKELQECFKECEKRHDPADC